MTLHIGRSDYKCTQCNEIFIPYGLNPSCPYCRSANPTSKEYSDFIRSCARSLRINRKRGSYIPGAWYIGSFSDFVQNALFEIFDRIERGHPKNVRGYVLKELESVQGDARHKKHVFEIFEKVYGEVARRPRDLFEWIAYFRGKWFGSNLPPASFDQKEDSIGDVSCEEKVSKILQIFSVCGEDFEIRHFPHLYGMVQTSRENAEAQLRSIANAWHDGSIVSAAQALESDLGHG
jgi:hypothetical protein